MLATVRRAGLLLLVMALLLGSGTDALAATVDVAVSNFRFSPPNVRTNQGNTVRWTNEAPSTSHTATSHGAPGTPTVGVGLWDSQVIPPGGGTFSFVFGTAATYPYFCKIHPTMFGSVVIPLKARPNSGDEDTRFRITWGAPPAGFSVDVQIRRPGVADFSDWMTGQTGSSATFIPDAGPGQYQFRSFLRNEATDGVSAFSPVKKISVS